MEKTVKFKNGYLCLADAGLTILKRGCNQNIPYGNIKEIGIVKANIFRRGVLYVYDGNDRDEYVPIHDRRRTLTYGFTDNVVIARLRYRIEKMAGIESDADFSAIKLSLFEKMRLMNPLTAVVLLWTVSLLCLLRAQILAMFAAFFNGDAARAVIGTQSLDGGMFGIFVVSSIVFVCVFILWVVREISDGIGARKEHRRNV